MSTIAHRRVDPRYVATPRHAWRVHRRLVHRQAPTRFQRFGIWRNEHAMRAVCSLLLNTIALIGDSFMRQPEKAQFRPAPHVPRNEFVFRNGPPYADKDEFIAKALSFDILALDFEKNGGYEAGQDRWLVRVLVNDGRPDEELLSFGTNPARDEQFRSAQAYIASHGPITNVHLEKRGNAYYIVNQVKSATT